MSESDSESRGLNITKDDVRQACEALEYYGLEQTVPMIYAFTLGRLHEIIASVVSDSDEKE